MRQSAVRTWASSRESNCQPLRNSSRRRPLNDSIQAFCQGEPGSMKMVSVPTCRHQSPTAWATNSGPLSSQPVSSVARRSGRVHAACGTSGASGRSATPDSVRSFAMVLAIVLPGEPFLGTEASANNWASGGIVAVADSPNHTYHKLGLTPAGTTSINWGMSRVRDDTIMTISLKGACTVTVDVCSQDGRYEDGNAPIGTIAYWNETSGATICANYVSNPSICQRWRVYLNQNDQVGHNTDQRRQLG